MATAAEEESYNSNGGVDVSSNGSYWAAVVEGKSSGGSIMDSGCDTSTNID